MKKPIISITAKDCRWTYYNGTGKGGSNRNKTQCCVKCFHDPSGAMGKAEDERSQVQNKKLAFKRMADTKKFKTWLLLETLKKNGGLEEIERIVSEEMTHLLIEGRTEGKWVKLKD